jgi:hypothetical protein
MAKPTLRVDGSASGAGTVDVARSDLQNGEILTITDTNPANSGGSFQFNLLDKPEGASNALITPTANPCTLLVDNQPVDGTWVVECVVDGVDKAEIRFAVLTPEAGLRKPSFDEELEWNEGGNTKGWKPDHSALVDKVEEHAVVLSGGVGDPDAIHDNVAGEINAVAEKATPVAADVVLIEDSAAGFAKKKAALSNLIGGSTDPDAIHDNVAGEINAIAAKSPTISTDQLLIEDAAAANAKKKVTVGDLRISENQITDLDHTDADAIHDNVNAEITALTLKSPMIAGDSFIIESAIDFNAKRRTRLSDLRITESQITNLQHTAAGGPGTDTDAIHDNVNSEITAIAAKSPPVAADVVLIEDSESFNAKKRSTVADLHVNAIHEDIASEIAGITEKTQASPADLLIMEDSDAAGVKKSVQVQNLLPPSAAARGDYLHVYGTGPNQAWSDGTAVRLTTIGHSRGGITVDGAGKFSGFKAGRTYLLIGTISTTDTGAHDADFGWYNVTDATGFGGAARALSTTSSSPHQNAQPRAITMFDPLVDSELELRMLTLNAGTPDVVNNARTNATIVEIGAVQAEVIGGLEFVDIIEVTTAPVASVSFGAGGDGELQRALDGEVDEEYFISSYLKKASTMTTLDLEPNGVGTNQVSRCVTMESSTVTFPRMVVAQPGAAGHEDGEIKLWAKTGRERGYTVLSNLQTADVATEGGQFIRTYAGTWDEIITPISSLVLKTNDASAGIDVGSRFILWRRTKNNLRADTAGLYERTVQAVVAQGTAAPEAYTTGESIFGGSAVGLGVSLIDDTVVSGTITVDLKVAGVTVLTAVLDSTNVSFHRAAAIVGANPIAFGDAITVDVTTSSLVTAGAGSPGLVINCTLVNDAFVQAAQGADFLAAARGTSVQNTNVNVNNHLEFNFHYRRGTSISISEGAGQAGGIITVQPGKIYEIHVEVTAQVNEGHSVSRLTLHPADTPLVGAEGVQATQMRHIDNVAHDVVSKQSCSMVIAPTVETSFKLDIVTDVNFVHWFNGSRIMVKELK